MAPLNWCQAVKEAGGKVSLSQTVKSIVDRIRERTKTPVLYLDTGVTKVALKN